MKIPRKVIIALIIVLLILTGVSLYSQYTSTQSTGPWTSTSPYPVQVSGVAGLFGQSCVTDSGHVYCVGGQDASGAPTSQVYAAQLSSSGIATWTNASSYPQSIMFQSCVTSSNYVYCVGGTKDSTGDDVNASYYASIGSGTLGAWNETTSFPTYVDSESCASSSGYIYCVGGENETSGTNATATVSSSLWYAQLSASGIGKWANSAAYPSGTFFPECTALGGYMYCVGGEDASGSPLSSTYYAYLTSQGTGAWTASTPYPVQVVAVACTTASTLIYCIDGLPSGGAAVQSVYYAGLVPSGIGGWQSAAGYPDALATDCVSYSGYIYCIGGYNTNTGAPTSDVYYAPLAVNSTETSSTSS